MKVIIDRARLARRARLAHGASLGGLLALLGSVGLTLFRPDLATPGAILLVAGFAVATIGIAQANRWVKRPRPEDVLDQALKGLNDHYRLYHYLDSAPPHILLTPGALLVIECRAGEGVFAYRGGQWRQKITMGKALRFFVEEPLGDPLRDAQRSAELLGRSVAIRLPAHRAVPVRAVVVFTHPAAVVSSSSAPLPVLLPKQLRSHAARGEHPLPEETYASVRAVLDADRRSGS